MESERAEKEAENMKLSMSDDTINKLAKYVHQVLDLRNLNCNYDVNQGKCRQCVKRKIMATNGDVDNWSNDK